MKRTKSLLSLLSCVLLLAVACDQGQDPEDLEALEDRAAEAAPLTADEHAPGEHARHHRRGHGGDGKLMRLCEKLECTDEQRTKIEGLVERLGPERGRGHDGDRSKGDRAAAHQALADAFAREALAPADLEAWRSSFRPEPGPRADARADALAPAMVELHGILDATQRDTLAQKIARHGLPFAGDRGKRHGKHDRGGDESALADEAAHKAARVCEPLSCTPEQQAQIAALVQVRPERPDVPEAARTALAEAFRGASLSESAVSAYLDAAAEARTQGHAAMDAQVVALHDLISPEQRAILADRIREDGPRALGLHGGGRHGGKKHRGKKRRRPRGEAEQGAQQLG